MNQKSVPYQKLGLQFSWTFEEEGDSVLKFVCLEMNGVQIDEFEELGLNEAGLSITVARKIAKKYAKSIGSELYDVTEEGMARDYSAALLICSNNNR